MSKEQFELVNIDVTEFESQLSDIVQAAHKGDLESYEKLLRIKEAIGSI